MRIPKRLRYLVKRIHEHDYDELINHRLASSLVLGGRVLGVGYNKIGYNQFVLHYSDLAEKEWVENTHAEQDAVLKTRKTHSLKGATCYVARVTPGGNVGLARPCATCQLVLSAYGIKKAVYTISDSEYGVLKIDPK